jgi:hypothetical protein
MQLQDGLEPLTGYSTDKLNQGNIHRAKHGVHGFGSPWMDHVDLSLSSLNLACENAASD